MPARKVKQASSLDALLYQYMVKGWLGPEDVAQIKEFVETEARERIAIAVESAVATSTSQLSQSEKIRLLLGRIAEQKSQEAARFAADKEWVERHDPMTKLLNKPAFEEDLEKALREEQRGRWIVVGMVDMRNFKWYNDSFGHKVGDKILNTFSLILPSQIREDEHHRTARYGGDEFAFYIVGFNSWLDAASLATRVRDVVAEYPWAGLDPRLEVEPVVADIGVVCFRLPTLAERQTISTVALRDSLLQMADDQMYRAKRDRATHIYAIRTRVVNGKLIVTEEFEETDKT